MTISLSRSRPASRAFTLTEMMVAVGIFSIMLLTLSVSMWFFARNFKSTLSQNRLQEQARYLMLRLSNLSSVSTGISIIDKNGGTLNCLRIVYTYTDNDGNQTDKTADFSFEEAKNADGDSLGYSAIYEYPEPVSDPNRRMERLLYVTKVGATNIWRENPDSSRLLFEVLARAGDRTNPPDRTHPTTDEDVAKAIADDALTGPGYQSFVLQCSLAPSS